jgi:hypothetical protein
MRPVVLIVLALFPWFALPTEPEDFLAAYARRATSSDPGFAGFSADRGRAFYFVTHRLQDGSELSCASCHHADPRQGTVAHRDQIPCRACHITLHEGSQGRSMVIREIRPLAQLVNPDRFTNEWKVEAWFEWNCKLLLQRECTPLEKGDLITWLMTIEQAGDMSSGTDRFATAAACQR